jgi:tripartite motif-containing protein 2/3
MLFWVLHVVSKITSLTLTPLTLTLQCEAKLCDSCAAGHKKLPALKNHELSDINTLTVQRLVEHYLSSCRAHDDRPAEFYCLQHYELICMLCASTYHRGCSEVKAIAEAAKEKRSEMASQAEKLREREKTLSKQVSENNIFIIVLFACLLMD